MSIRGELRVEVEEAFTEFGDVVEDGTLIPRGHATENPTTGVVTSVDGCDRFKFVEARLTAIEAVLGRTMTIDMDTENLGHDDLRIVILGSTLDAALKLKDKVTLRSASWEVLGFDDVLAIVFIVKLRRTRV